MIKKEHYNNKYNKISNKVYYKIEKNDYIN